MTNLLSQYRLRNLAVQLRRFTVTDLASASRSSVPVVQSFLNRFERNQTDVLTKENLSSDRPGRPVILYGLTPKGVRLLAAQIAPLAQQLNELKVETLSSAADAKPERAPSRPALGQQFADWLWVFGNDFKTALETGAAALLINTGQPATLRTAGEVSPLPAGAVWSAEKIED